MLNESIAKCWVSTDKVLNPEGFCVNIDSRLKAGDFCILRVLARIWVLCRIVHFKSGVWSCLFLSTCFWAGCSQWKTRRRSRSSCGRSSFSSTVKMRSALSSTWRGSFRSSITQAFKVSNLAYLWSHISILISRWFNRIKLQQWVNAYPP